MSVRVVLQEDDIARALTRMAHEIVESNKGVDSLVLLGVPTRGVLLAQRIAAVIQRIEPSAQNLVGQLDVTLYRDDLANQPTRTPSVTKLPEGGIDGATVVLVDDVLYSGRTVRSALDALGDYGRPRVVRLATLIDRGHRELPIRADMVGKNIPSAVSERIHVRLREHDGVDEVTIES